MVHNVLSADFVITETVLEVRTGKRRISLKKWFVYAAIISVVFAGASYLTLEAENGTPVAANISYGQRVIECEQGTNEQSCIKDLISSAVKEGNFQDLAADLAKSPSLNMTCTKVIHEMIGENLLRMMNTEDLIADTDTPACNGALAEKVMPIYAESLDEQGWEDLASSCVKRVSFSVPGKTTPCAKGLGWAVASAEETLEREFKRCRDLIDQAVADTGLNWESNDLARYTYGCAHGLMMAHHAPHGVPLQYRSLDALLKGCKELLSVEGRDAMSLRSGCAGGLGTALGQRIWGKENPLRATGAALVSCSMLTGNLDMNAPEWQCAHQIFRQNANTIFVEKPEAEKYCTNLYKNRDQTLGVICKEEADRRFAT